MPLKISDASGATERCTGAPPGSTEVLTGWQCELGEPAHPTAATSDANVNDPVSGRPITCEASTG